MTFLFSSPLSAAASSSQNTKISHREHAREKDTCHNFQSQFFFFLSQICFLFLEFSSNRRCLIFFHSIIFAASRSAAAGGVGCCLLRLLSETFSLLPKSCCCCENTSMLACMCSLYAQRRRRGDLEIFALPSSSSSSLPVSHSLSSRMISQCR
jgi:hypothetical protein